MASQLPADCLNEIFEHLDDRVDLRSCSLVNSLWCNVSVPILWTNIQNYNVLIACLPNESKEILLKNEIITSTPNPPLFYYVTFIKNVSIEEIGRKIQNLLKKHQPISFDNSKCLIVAQEVFKMFMNQTSLKNLNYNYSSSYISNIQFTAYPGAMGCLRNLTELNCCSDLSSGFFYQLSQICRNLQSLKMTIRDIISDGLADLISGQRNLKCLSIKNYNGDWKEIIPSLTKLPDDLIKLDFDADQGYEPIPLSFIAKFTNLQELVLSFNYNTESFKNLQHVFFPQLQILRFNYKCPNHDYLIKFLENNGKNLIEIYLDEVNINSLNLAISNFCPKLKSLYTIFNYDEVETLKSILNKCQQLESIDILCGGDFYLDETESLEVFHLKDFTN